ncbi:MAG: serine O-acetyltransferase [Bryobacterales bacterium]|nr:serine O-acetyltransferase [Bryobacterales bacterium]
MSHGIREQIQTVFKHDPAAKNAVEVLLCYPGVHAILLHRFAHRLYRWRWFVLARLVSHLSRLLTGIEIHPGASIGRRFFIDHGMGVVIGETSVIGNDVLLYQGVTLGGTGHGQERRHPTLGDHVVVGSGAKVLGNIELGEWVKVGAGSVVVKSVPAHATVVGIPGRVVAVKGVSVTHDEWQMLEHGELPDPVGQTLANLNERLSLLEAEAKAQAPAAPSEQDINAALPSG